MWRGRRGRNRRLGGPRRRRRRRRCLRGGRCLATAAVQELSARRQGILRLRVLPAELLQQGLLLRALEELSEVLDEAREGAVPCIHGRSALGQTALLVQVHDAARGHVHDVQHLDLCLVVEHGRGTALGLLQDLGDPLLLVLEVVLQDLPEVDVELPLLLRELVDLAVEARAHDAANLGCEPLSLHHSGLLLLRQGDHVAVGLDLCAVLRLDGIDLAVPAVAQLHVLQLLALRGLKLQVDGVELRPQPLLPRLELLHAALDGRTLRVHELKARLRAIARRLQLLPQLVVPLCQAAGVALQGCGVPLRLAADTRQLPLARLGCIALVRH
mmetsp:Transcript_40622/g.129103  ORF Transcript_40622/g.129103 Transcript_40622/m.129103 type:complete len:328 (-) Transcript_40622:217-1200(-)